MPVTTVILAGGQGKRIGGGKALQRLRGRPLIDWVMEAVRPQSHEVLISANDRVAEYMHYGCGIVADVTPGSAGPLAGLQAAMQCAGNDRIASVPCDTPFLPGDLVERLSAALDGAEAAVAVVNGRRQPAIALYRREVLPKLDAYLASGERRAGKWLAMLQVQEVEFDDVAAFTNINTQAELNNI